MDIFKCYACEKIVRCNDFTHSMLEGWDIIKILGVPLLFCPECLNHFEGKSLFADNPAYISDYMKNILAEKLGVFPRQILFD